MDFKSLIRTLIIGTAGISFTLNVAQAEHSLYRLVWKDDASSTITVGWRNQGGNDHRVIMGEDTNEANWQTYPAQVTRNLGNIVSSFVDINNLKASTTYYFKVCDSTGCTPQKYFITAPDNANEPFTFIAGGDSRSNTQARRNANQLVAKLRPLFIAFGGDYMNTSANDDEMEQWLEDWQLTESDDGRMYPIVPTMGNHENDDYGMMQEIFNVRRDNAEGIYYYYNLSIGGSMLRLYTLNSELKGDEQLWNIQLTQFEDDLKANFDKHIWNVAQYHHSIMPHTNSKPAVYDIMLDDFLPLFSEYDIDLAIECDSHVVKATHPSITNGNTLVRDDEKGTVFIGEGTWGTTPRTANRSVDEVTRARGSFNQIKYIQLSKTEMDIRTVRTANAQDVATLSQAQQNQDPFAMPNGLDLWSPADLGPVLNMKADGGPDIDTPVDDTPNDDGSGNDGSVDGGSGEEIEAAGSLNGIDFLLLLVTLGALLWVRIPQSRKNVTKK